jgi:alkaline phosphatase
MRKGLRPATMLAIVVLLVSAIAVAVVTAPPSASGGKPPGGQTGYPGVKNVILIIGDGMGPQETQLARSLDGGSLLLDGIPWAGVGTIDTTSLDGVTDSAAAATALATGYETHNGWLSMIPTPSGPVSVQTVLERAELKGRATGLVTTAEISAATPAAFGAHVTDRDLDEEITTQIAGQGTETLFSGSWSYDVLLRGLPGVTYVNTLDELLPYLQGSVAWTPKMYGFFGRMAYPLDREEEGVVGKQPTLAQTTAAAIGVLKQDSDGFFLMVEQATIDYGGHARDPGWVGADVNDFDRAVKVAYDWAKGRSDTLLVVTADHETGGLVLNSKTNYAAIRKQTATTEWMWGLIAANKMTIKQTLATYAGITDLTVKEESEIALNKEMGISNVLAARDKVAWGWGGSDEGDHTATPVAVRAWGPGAAAFKVTLKDNEYIGQQLLTAVSN